MGERKRRRAAAKPIELPISDGGPDITATDIFPTLDAIWLHLTEHPALALQDATRQRRESFKFGAYTMAAELVRLIIFRINFDQDTRVIDEIGGELRAFDKEMARINADYAAALN